MSDEIRRLSVNGPSWSFSQAFSLGALFVSYLLGVAFTFAARHWNYTPRFDLFFFRLPMGSGKLELLWRIVIFLAPCVLIWLFSTSTSGWLFLPGLFFAFGCLTAFPCRNDSFTSYTELFLCVKKLLPAFFLLPALFLLGEVGFQKSFQLYRFSGSGLPVSVIKMPRERVIVAFALVLLAAVLRQYVVPHSF